jgi:hypothetical protein
MFHYSLFNIQECPTVDDDEDKPISYTVKLKDSDDSSTPTMKKQKNKVIVMKHQVILKNLQQHRQ